MSKQSGQLSIHSENIFPIIKKWLYSDHDIFIRELISNACDATTKLKTLTSLHEAEIEENPDFSIKVVLDKNSKTLTFKDAGIGMTDEEIKKYINQIAFSGAEDFLKNYKDKDDKDQIIGHFGLGFYSAFMVAEKIDIHTLSYKKDAKPVMWSCDGGTTFEMEEGSRSTRGTDIILHIGEDGTDFLEGLTVSKTIEKYCSFMPYPIFFDDLSKEPEKDEEGNIVISEPKPLNTTEPLYTKSPSTCTDEEYKEFYQKTFMDFKEPLFWIHLNMDYPFNLKGILYFPKIGTQFDTIEGQIKLFNNQVFVADNIKEVTPEFLLLLKGVIDCPDLPLNVSRSSLQNDGFVRKISDYITKKVADKLNGLFKNERENFENFWDDINPFIKFGAIRDPKFYEKTKNLFLYKCNDNSYKTLEEYLEFHNDKLENSLYYTTDEVQQAQYIDLLKSHDILVATLNHSIDQPFISHVESQNEKLSFKRVDADLSDILKDNEAEIDEETKTAEKEILLKTFKEALSIEKINLSIENLKSDEVASMIILSEDNRRMQDMFKMYNMPGMDNSMFPSEETLLLNKKHTLVKYLLEHPKSSDLNDLIAKQLYDLALLSHKPLSPNAMTSFIKRSNVIMTKILENK